MKPFDTLTPEELAELPDDRLARYINLAHAEAGVPLSPMAPPTPPSNETVADDMTVYKIGSSFSDLAFLDREAAQRVCDTINQAEARGYVHYLSGPSFRKRFERSHSMAEVTIEKCLSPERVATHGAAVEAFERAKKEYDEAHAAFERDDRARREIAREFHEKIGAARTRRQRVMFLERELARYLELADGNTAVAARFLAMAHSDARELLPAVFAGLESELPAPEKKREPAPVVADEDIPF